MMFKKINFVWLSSPVSTPNPTCPNVWACVGTISWLVIISQNTNNNDFGLENFKCSIIMLFYTDVWIELKDTYNNYYTHKGLSPILLPKLSLFSKRNVKDRLNNNNNNKALS